MLNVTLWIVQVLMALVFLAHGLLLLVPPASLVDQMNATLGTALRLFIGVAEVAGASGLILPGVTRILPWLVPLAAAGLSIVMVCATVFHIARNEIGGALVTLVLLAMVGFVAYVRWKIVPIAPRQTARRSEPGSASHA